MKKSILTLLVAFTLAGLAVAVPVANASQSQQASVREKLGEVGAWAVPSPPQGTVSSKPLTGQSQQAIVREKLGEIGAWAVPSPSTGPVASSGDGFDWNQAGWGAALAFGTILVGTAGVVAIRRYHGPLAH